MVKVNDFLYISEDVMNRYKCLFDILECILSLPFYFFIVYYVLLTYLFFVYANLEGSCRAVAYEQDSATLIQIAYD